MILWIAKTHLPGAFGLGTDFHVLCTSEVSYIRRVYQGAKVSQVAAHGQSISGSRYFSTSPAVVIMRSASSSIRMTR